MLLRPYICIKCHSMTNNASEFQHGRYKSLRFADHLHVGQYINILGFTFHILTSKLNWYQNGTSAKLLSKIWASCPRLANVSDSLSINSNLLYRKCVDLSRESVETDKVQPSFWICRISPLLYAIVVKRELFHNLNLLCIFPRTSICEIANTNKLVFHGLCLIAS